MGKKHRINLLPPRLMQHKRRRRVLTTLAAVQIFVLAVLAGVFALLHTRYERATLHSQDLARQIAAIPASAQTAAEEMHSITLAFNLAQDFIAEAFPDTFNPQWLTAILDTRPAGVALATIGYGGEEVHLTALAAEFEDITLHRYVLLASGYFYAVLLGETARQADGNIRYELRLVPATP